MVIGEVPLKPELPTFPMGMVVAAVTALAPLPYRYPVSGRMGAEANVHPPELETDAESVLPLLTTK
jgi:hypothetical protein